MIAEVKMNEIIPPVSRLAAYSLDDFLRMQIPAREDILAPILQTQSLSMLYAKRGVGKTHVALNIAYAISSGGGFLRWNAPQPRPVLYIDGEMPASAMQQRLSIIDAQYTQKADPAFFSILTPDMQEYGMPDISTQHGQDMLSPFVEGAEFIIVDNISTLARTGKENEAEGWLPIQEWALRLRSQGKSVMFVHHAGKGGQQRGTSRREDTLDLVIELRHPEDYKTDDGARFEVHFTKARHLAGGEEAKAFEARLNDGSWSFCDIEHDDLLMVLGLKKEGRTVREIAEKTGISKSQVQRMMQLQGQKS